MSICCSDILKLPALKALKVIGGAEGLNRQIRWVYFGDNIDNLSDSVNYINGHELFVTTGRTLIGAHELIDILPKLDKMNIAGILINVGPYFSDISENLIEVADRLKLPLFVLPWEVKLVNVSHAICNAIINDEIDEAKAASLLEVLLFNNTKSVDELHHIMVSSNIDYGDGCLIGVCSIVNISSYLSTHGNDLLLTSDIRNNLLHCVKAAFSQFSIYMPMMQHQDGIIFLMPDNHRIKVQLSTQLQKVESEFCHRFPELKLHTGIGGSYKSPIDFKKSFQEANKALMAATVQSLDTRLTFYEDISLYSLLLNVNDMKILEDFYQKTFGALIEYDRTNNSELYQTLVTYFENNADSQNTAASLFIHKNTLKYRLEKINSILGCDIKDTKTFLKLGVGIEAGKILNVYRCPLNSHKSACLRYTHDISIRV